MTHVIANANENNVSLYACTPENAYTILDWYLPNIDPNIPRLANSNLKLISKSKITKILNIILNEEFNKLPTSITANTEHKQELIMFCFNHNIPISNNKINQYLLFKLNFDSNQLLELSFMKNYLPDSFETVDEHLIDSVHTYNAIMNHNWKQDISDITKVKYILSFVNTLTDSDNQFHVEEIKEKA